MKDEDGAWLHSVTPPLISWHRLIKRLYPSVKLAIGPSVADGFYYDMDSETPLTADDLEKIEAEMKKIVKEASADRARFTLPREEAIAYYERKRRAI